MVDPRHDPSVTGDVYIGTDNGVYLSRRHSLNTISLVATPLNQYASSVLGFSSQWTFSGGTSWNASQALGAPDTFAYGDFPTAWSPVFPGGPPNPEFLELGYTTAVNATGVVVRETDNNGFVEQIDLLDTNGVLHTVFGPNGADSSRQARPPISPSTSRRRVTWFKA